MDKERDDIESRHQELDQEVTQLNQQSFELWEALNAVEFDTSVFNECRDTAMAQLAALDRSATGTEDVNVLGDVFSISYDGPFATINGFRMGRLPKAPVEWNEINAALGAAALLMCTLANKVGLEFQEYVGLLSGYKDLSSHETLGVVSRSSRWAVCPRLYE